MGLADGMLLFETMHGRTHPIGKLRGNVRYSDVYDYLNCLEISPCTGWMTTNATLRAATQARANELSATLAELAQSEKFAHFDVHFFPNPLKEIFDEWTAQGGEGWQLVEPIDGFHPAQDAQPLIVEHFVAWAQAKVPGLIPSRNPHNEEIEQLFGDQGGY